METGSKVRVLLVDDNFMVRQTMRNILQPHADIIVVGEASDGDEAVAYVSLLQPVLVVMDMNMHRTDGIRATRSIKTEYPHFVKRISRVQHDVRHLRSPHLSSVHDDESDYVPAV